MLTNKVWQGHSRPVYLNLSGTFISNNNYFKCIIAVSYMFGEFVGWRLKKKKSKDKGGEC